MYLVNAFKLLRVSAEGEAYGLDLHEHGISAYPEYVITSAGRPVGMPVEASEHAAAETIPRMSLNAGHASTS
jgi:Amt family ammonium transporter